MNATEAEQYMAWTTSALSAKQAWLSKRELERRVLAALQTHPTFRDVTGVDVEPIETGVAGTWHVARIWRGHVVELPRGSAWDAGARASIEHLRRGYRLDPRGRLVVK